MLGGQGTHRNVGVQVAHKQLARPRACTGCHGIHLLQRLRLLLGCLPGQVLLSLRK